MKPDAQSDRVLVENLRSKGNSILVKSERTAMPVLIRSST